MAYPEMSAHFRRARFAGLALCSCLALAACGTSSNNSGTTSGTFSKTAPSSPRYKVGKPYQVAGVWYYPREDTSYDNTGIASWYGPQFDGKHTANGETFDMNAISAAHPTLPMPVLVRVTNLENGKSIIVRVNDRGPFVNGREIDLSKRAAELLGYANKGTAKVRVQFVGIAPMEPGEDRTMATATTETDDGHFYAPKPQTEADQTHVASAPVGSVSSTTVAALPPPPGSSGSSGGSITSSSITSSSMAPIPDDGARAGVQAPDNTAVETVPVPADTGIYVQAGAFRVKENAYKLSRSLNSIGHVSVTSTKIDGLEYYRVRVGPMRDVESADSALSSVIAKGLSGARIIVD